MGVGFTDVCHMPQGCNSTTIKLLFWHKLCRCIILLAKKGNYCVIWDGCECQGGLTGSLMPKLPKNGQMLKNAQFAIYT